MGLVDWSLDRKGLTSGFVPEKVADDLDFVSVHLYPKKGQVDEALKTLAGFAVGKPVLIEETFPLACSPEELEEFIDGSKKHAAGWIGFYWGKPPEELRRSKTISDALTLGWLELFEKKAKALEQQAKRPTIKKLGTIDLLMVETTPVVFKDRLYRFEYVRDNYHANKTGASLLPLHRRGERQGDPGVRQGQASRLRLRGRRHGLRLRCGQMGRVEHHRVPLEGHGEMGGAAGLTSAWLGVVQHVSLQGQWPLRHGDRSRRAKGSGRCPIHHFLRRLEGLACLEAAAPGLRLLEGEVHGLPRTCAIWTATFT